MDNNAISKKRSFRNIEFLHSTTFYVILFIAVFSTILAIVSENFMTTYNVGIILRQMSFFGMAALGQTLVLLIGGIDLSVGSTACFSGIIFSILMVKLGIDPIISVTVALAVGALIGYINGLLITKCKLTPFIVTLAISGITAGFVLVTTEGYTISGISGPVLVLGQGMVGGVIPVPIIIFIVFLLILTYILKFTPFGRELYSIGGNASASRLVGINVDRKKRIVYTISGALSALGGIMIACRYNSGQPTIGGTWVMDSITAAVIGGASMNGGVGTVLGTLVGALLMTVLSNSIVILNVNQNWEQVMTGGVVLIAVIIDAVQTQIRRKAI
ncbi:MAG: ABC transporter permease [Oscillospiraceae bacterium]